MCSWGRCPFGSPDCTLSSASLSEPKYAKKGTRWSMAIDLSIRWLSCLDGTVWSFGHQSEKWSSMHWVDVFSKRTFERRASGQIKRCGVKPAKASLQRQKDSCWGIGGCDSKMRNPREAITKRGCYGADGGVVSLNTSKARMDTLIGVSILRGLSLDPFFLYKEETTKNQGPAILV